MLTAWTSKNNKKIKQNDFFRPFRKYTDRMEGFKYVSDRFRLTADHPIVYLEFGVASGVSFKWWMQNNTHENSRFYGFDTFEGLPENWGFFYKKGDMKHEVMASDDNRHVFIKGIFQDTFLKFIGENLPELNSAKRKVIHLDADLFSSTLFVLSQIYPYLKKGDILIFDEFSVPNHEFFAAQIFQKSFYVQLEPISAINNFYQTIFQVV